MALILMCQKHLKHVLKWSGFIWLVLGVSILSFSADVFLVIPDFLPIKIAAGMSVLVGIVYVIDYFATTAEADQLPTQRSVCLGT